MKLYRAIALDPRLAHFVHIPDRIVGCLDRFGVEFDRTRVLAALRSYYLFIGVVDEAIDSGELEIGNEVLERLRQQVPSFDYQTRTSRVHLATEMLKRDISKHAYSEFLTKLGELHQAVLYERRAETMFAYIEARKQVGSLTAELSYLLIRPFLDRDREAFSRMMKRVGAVGCLVDSVLDLAADADRDLLSFKPGPLSFLKLVGYTLREGVSVSLKHPALFRLFLEGIIDNVKDRSRADRNEPQEIMVSGGKEQAPSVV
jgi:hypothetical protein